MADLFNGLNSRMHCLVHVSQTLTLPSSEPDTSVQLSAENASDPTLLLCPSITLDAVTPSLPPPLPELEIFVWSPSAAARLSRWMLPVEPPMHTRSPSGQQAMLSAASGRLRRRHCKPAATSNNTTVLSKEQVNTRKGAAPTLPLPTKCSPVIGSV